MGVGHVLVVSGTMDEGCRTGCDVTVAVQMECRMMVCRCKEWETYVWYVVMMMVDGGDGYTNH